MIKLLKFTKTSKFNYPIKSRDLAKAKPLKTLLEVLSELADCKVQALKGIPLLFMLRMIYLQLTWFLNHQDDTVSSYYLEGYCQTEFDIQGLEIDYTCVTFGILIFISDLGIS